jgi:hypothetical protein
MMLRDRPPQIGGEITFATAAELMLRELEELGRKPTTLANYRQTLDFRLLPAFGEIPSAASNAAKSKPWRPRCCEKASGHRLAQTP